MSDQLLLAQELARWGAKNATTLAQPDYCENLLITLRTNYPCMSTGTCTGIDDPAILLVGTISVLCAFAIGYYVHKRWGVHDGQTR